MSRLQQWGMATALLASLAMSSASFAGSEHRGKVCPDHPHQAAEFGGEHQSNHAMGFKRMARALDLTEEQKASLKALHQGKQAQQQQQMSELHAAHKALMDAADAGASTAELAPLADKLGKLKAQQSLARAQAQQEFQALLTPEQKQKMKDMKAKREAKRAARQEQRES